MTATLLVGLMYIVAVLLLPSVMKVFIPCLHHLPTQSASYLYQRCNTGYVLDMFIVTTLIISAVTILAVFVMVKRSRLPFWIVPAVAILTGGVSVAAYYHYIPTAMDQVNAAPIDLYESFRADN